MYVGIDIGGTTIKHGLINKYGKVYERDSIKTPLEKERFLESVTKIINVYKEKEDIQGVGISVPGIIQKNGHMITAGSIHSLYGMNLKEIFENTTKLPVSVDNDANAAAIAERWIGNAQGIDNYLCVALGTGIGGGIVINGQIYRGAHGMAGEFGWMIVDQIPKTDNIETASLNQRAAIVGGLCHQFNQRVSSEEQIYDAKKIFAMESTNKIAKETIECFFKDLSIGLLNLISCFDPEIILIGGGISENEVFFSRLKQELMKMEDRHQSISYLKEKTIAPIIPTLLKNDAGMIGATYQIHRQIQNKNVSI